MIRIRLIDHYLQWVFLLHILSGNKDHPKLLRLHDAHDVRVLILLQYFHFLDSHRQDHVYGGIFLLTHRE